MSDCEKSSRPSVDSGEGALASRFTALFENIEEGVALHELVLDANGNPVDYLTLDVNPQFEACTGFRRSEIVGRLASEVSGTGKAPHLETFASAVLSRSPVRIEIQLTRVERQFAVSIAPTGPRSFVAIFSDVTLAKRQAAAIEKSRLSLRALLDNQPHLAWLKDREGRFLAVNRAFAQACGQPNPEVVVGKSDLEVWPLELAEAYRADDSSVMASGTQKMVEEQIAEVEGTRWFETYKSPVFDPGGKIVGTTGIARDITERKRAEEARLQSERKLGQILDLAPDPIAVINAKGEWTFANQAFCELCGHQRSEFQGHKTTELEVWEDAGVPAAIAERLQHGGHVKGVEAVLRSRGGARHHVEFTATLVEFDEATSIILVGRDVTQSRKLEQQVMQSQKLESLGVLAGGIAHDFNNLLTSVLGNADLAGSELSPTNPARPYLDDIEKVARRAADLCKQMLAYSGKGRFVVQPISFNEVVREMGHLLNVSISKKVIVKYNFFADLPSVMADATQMRQVVMNLITNASEAIGEASGVVTLSTGVMDCDEQYLASVVDDRGNHPPGQYVYLEVSDTGCGMDQETLGKIFDPFFTTKFTGRGLGLAAVLGIVRGHKGALRVYSEKGRGTTFKVLLPAHDQATPSSLSGKDEIGPWRGSGLVLLADDEDSIRSMGRRLLERAGFEVMLAADGREAVDLFMQHRGRVRLVVLDMTMPHLDGEVCYRELRRINPAVKVIMTSGYNEQEVINRFVGKGLAGFVQKPYKASDLLSVLRDVLEPTGH